MKRGQGLAVAAAKAFFWASFCTLALVLLVALVGGCAPAAVDADGDGRADRPAGSATVDPVLVAASALQVGPRIAIRAEVEGAAGSVVELAIGWSNGALDVATVELGADGDGPAVATVLVELPAACEQVRAGLAEAVVSLDGWDVELEVPLEGEVVDTDAGGSAVLGDGLSLLCGSRSSIDAWVVETAPYELLLLGGGSAVLTYGDGSGGLSFGPGAAVELRAGPWTVEPAGKAYALAAVRL